MSQSKIMLLKKIWVVQLIWASLGHLFSKTFNNFEIGKYVINKLWHKIVEKN